MPDLNPNEDIEKDETLEGESDDLNFLDEEKEETQKPQEEQDATALEIFNKKVGKSYKSWEDVSKSEKQRDIDFAKKGIEKTVEKPMSSEISERLLRVEQPESKFMIDEIKKDHPGEDPYKYWNSSEYYRKEAKARAEAEENKKRIANPSGNSDGQPARDPMSQKFMRNFPPAIEKAMKKMAKG